LTKILTLDQGLRRGAKLEDFVNIMQNDKTCQYDGFMFHEHLGYGKMIKTYPYGCQSPRTQSWPLFLREQQSGWYFSYFFHFSWFIYFLYFCCHWFIFLVIYLFFSHWFIFLSFFLFFAIDLFFCHLFICSIFCYWCIFSFFFAIYLLIFYH